MYKGCKKICKYLCQVLDLLRQCFCLGLPLVLRGLLILLRGLCTGVCRLLRKCCLFVMVVGICYYIMFRYVRFLDERGEEWEFESIHDLLGLDETTAVVKWKFGLVPHDRPLNVTITNTSIFIVDSKIPTRFLTWDINKTVFFETWYDLVEGS